MKSRLLVWLSNNWKKNMDTDYPQTWYYVPKNKYARRFCSFLCSILGGHELSNTEWGYGGGKYADRWCRWCNEMVQVPKESIYFRFKEGNPRELMKEVKGSHIA